VEFYYWIALSLLGCNEKLCWKGILKGINHAKDGREAKCLKWVYKFVLAKFIIFTPRTSFFSRCSPKPKVYLTKFIAERNVYWFLITSISWEATAELKTNDKRRNGGVILMFVAQAIDSISWGNLFPV